MEYISILSRNARIDTIILLWLLIFFAFSVSSKNVALAQQRYQAMSLSFLTELPERDGTNVPFASEQKQNKGELKVSNEARITPPFAYDRSDQYLAPDFNSFFPDDPAGGIQLDALLSGSLGGHHKPEDVLAAIRQGLRHTQVYQSQVLAQVGGFVWGVKEQNPQAIELLYHASDTRGPVLYDGMYYGLTVLKNRPLNVVRTLINNYDSFTSELSIESVGGWIRMAIPRNSQPNWTSCLSNRSRSTTTL